MSIVRKRPDLSARNTIHGETGTRLYKTWCHMKARCLNPKEAHYSRYGGRGISFCPEWNEYVPFRDWALANGYAENLQLDRINNDGDYEPANCRFVTSQLNNWNRRDSVLLTVNGETACATEWSRRIGHQVVYLVTRYGKAEAEARIRKCLEA